MYSRRIQIACQFHQQSYKLFLQTAPALIGLFYAEELNINHSHVLKTDRNPEQNQTQGCPPSAGNAQDETLDQKDPL